MVKRCLIVVLIVLSVCCARGQDDWRKWAVVSNEKSNIDYEALTWTSWTGSKMFSLWGNVYVARPCEKADFDVKIVKSRTEWADLDINITYDDWQNKGQWRFVGDRSKADFSIRFVKGDEHFSVRFISYKEWFDWWNFTGLPVIDHRGE